MKTERDVRRAGDTGDTIPEQANVYVPPRPLASLADHRTMDVKAIRLAAEVDPRQAATQLRLYAPPLKKDKSWIAPLLLALLAVGFIGLWWVTPEPLPLGTTSAKAPAPPGGPATAGAVTPGSPSTATTAATRQRSDAAEPPGAPSRATVGSTPAAPGTAAAAGTVLRAPPVVPGPAAPTAPASATHRPKQGRDPWLE